MLQRSQFNTPEFLETLRNRDPDAWRAFYEEQWRPLCAFIRARLSHSPNGQADSEELAQEVLCRAYTGITHFRGEAQLETWLRTIAQYAIIDAVRAAQRERRLSEGNAAMESVCEALHVRAVPEPEASALRQDLLRQLLRELNGLLGTYSGLFVKRYLEGLSEQEVAAAEGLKCGTASGYLVRARRLLRQHGARFGLVAAQVMDRRHHRRFAFGEGEQARCVNLSRSSGRPWRPGGGSSRRGRCRQHTALITSASRDGGIEVAPMWKPCAAG